MKILIRVSEILLGIIFLGAGLNGYVVLFGYEEIIPTSPAAMEFFNEPYLLAMEKGVEIIAGFMLLIRRFVPLAIILLASLVANILAFHIFVDSGVITTRHCRYFIRRCFSMGLLGALQGTVR